VLLTHSCALLRNFRIGIIVLIQCTQY